MERLWLQLTLVMVPGPCLSLSVSKHVWQNVYKPYGPVMCREICNNVTHSYIFNKGDLSCRLLNNSSRSISKDSFVSFNHKAMITDTKLIMMKGNHSCDEYIKGDTSKNLQLLFPEQPHLNHTMLLHTASKEGNLCLVQHILSKGLVDINCRGKSGYTPVMTAARYGQAAVFDYLVAEGCDIAVVNDYHNTVLHTACMGGNTAIVEKLIADMKYDVDVRGWRELSPVMIAGTYGHVEVVDLLLSKGCNMALTDSHNNNILHLVCYSGRVSVVQHILKLNLFNIDSKGEKGRTAIILAAQSGHIPVVDLLISKHCDVAAIDIKGNNLLHCASLAGKVDMVRYIVENNVVGIDSRGNAGRTAVMIAGSIGQQAVVELLFRKNCTMTAVDNVNNNILHLVCRRGFVNMVKYILKMNIININSKGYSGRTALMLAAQSGYEKIVRLLVRKKCNLTATDDGGNVILHAASISGNIQMMKYILRLNAVDIDSRGHNGRTPVMTAALDNDVKMVNLLVSEKCDLKIADDSGNTILHILCSDGRFSMVKYFVGLNVLGVDIRGQYGRTAAMLAARGGHMEVLKLFVSKNCDLNAVDKFGNNILHFACMGDDLEMVRYILSCGPLLLKSKNTNDQTPANVALMMGHLQIANFLQTNDKF